MRREDDSSEGKGGRTTKVGLSAAVALAAALMATNGGMSVGTWDVRAAYTIDDANATVDFDLVGVYTHIINCGTEWVQMDTSQIFTPSTEHIITYSWSYVRAEIEARVQEDNVVDITTFACSQPELELRDGGFVTCVGENEWICLKLRSAHVPSFDDCHDLGVDGRSGTAPITSGWTNEIHTAPSTTDGVCFRLQGARLDAAPSRVPLTGQLVDNQMTKGHFFSGNRLAEGHTCLMIAGVCWGDAFEQKFSAGPLCEPDFCPLSFECHVRFLSEFVPGVGDWKCAVDYYNA